MRSVIEQEVCSFIRCNFLFSRRHSLGNDDSFLESGIIDSTGLLELVSFLERRYGITLEPDELIPDNLDSVTRLAKFIIAKLDKAKSVNANSVGTPELSTGA